MLKRTIIAIGVLAAARLGLGVADVDFGTCGHSDETLLIVFMKHLPNLAMLDFWKTMYHPFRTVYYADMNDCDGHNALGAPCFGPRLNVSSYPPEVHFVPMLGGGWFMHKALMQAIEDYPSYEGYLFIADDVQLHFWELAKLDHGKAWLGSTTAGFCSSVEAPTKTFARMAHLEGFYAATGEEYRKLIKSNLGAEDMFCQASQADFVYLPRALTPAWMKLCRQMTEHELFFTACFGNGVFGIAPNDRIIRLASIYGEPGGKFLSHPVKFSNHANRQRFAATQAEHCPRIDEVLTGIVPADVKSVSVKIGIWREQKRQAADGFWVQFDPQNHAQGPHSVTLPFIVEPGVSQMVAVKPFHIHSFGQCSSINLPSNTLLDEAAYLNTSLSRCANPRHPSFLADSFVIDHSRSTTRSRLCWLCSNRSEVTRIVNFPTVSLAEVIKAINLPIDRLEIDAQGSDTALVMSIAPHLHLISQIQIECQTGMFLYSSPITNDCNVAMAFLELHDFYLAEIEVNNCACQEYNLIFKRVIGGQSQPQSSPHPKQKKKTQHRLNQRGAAAATRPAVATRPAAARPRDLRKH